MTMHGHRPAPPACIMITLCHTFDQASLHTCVVTHSDSVHWRAPHVCACEFACVCVCDAAAPPLEVLLFV